LDAPPPASLSIILPPLVTLTRGIFDHNIDLNYRKNGQKISEVFANVSKEDSQLPTASDTLQTKPETDTFLTSEQLKKLDFINALWGDSKDEFPDSLTPLEKTGFPERTAIKYSDYFRDIGAIEKVQGRPCKPKWPLSKIKRYIESEGVS
jgi:hypothetical protein